MVGLLAAFAASLRPRLARRKSVATRGRWAMLEGLERRCQDDRNDAAIVELPARLRLARRRPLRHSRLGLYLPGDLRARSRAYLPRPDLELCRARGGDSKRRRFHP